MSILASLVRAYERLADAPAIGFSPQKISFLIALNEDGTPAGAPHDLRSHEGKRAVDRTLAVPQPTKRTVGIAPNFLWDKTSYALGVTAGEGRRVAREHAAFIEKHTRDLAGTSDTGLLAFLAFLRWWRPERFAELGWPDEMKDRNVIFGLEADRLSRVYLHDRPAAKALWARLGAEGNQSNAICLVTGVPGPVARLHPAIKGVRGAQSSGASIVSFNLDAFTSYGHEQGDNAPISEATAFAYTGALNHFLATDSPNRIQIGDASTVFWTDASEAAVAQEADGLVAAMFADVPIDENTQAQKVGAKLEAIRRGLPLADVDPKLAEGVRFHVLGLSPNAARLSIRFWFEDDFGVLAKNYQRFISDMRVDPPPSEPYPALWKYLAETAVLGKRENVPPTLAGDWMRAILTGAPYPLTLLSTVLMRIRADHEINGLRAGMLRAVLVRNLGMAAGNQQGKEKEAPVSLDPENRNKGYLLGRLFATYEHAQTAALGRDVNSTIKDKFYGAASATPRNVFALLDRGSANHLSKLGKDKPAYRVSIENTIAGIMEAMSPDGDPFPASLATEDQALFGLGYYHQKYFRKPGAAASEETAQ